MDSITGFPMIPRYGGIGLKSFFGTLLPPTARVQFVRSTGPQSYDDEYVKQSMVKTLEAAMARCTAGAQDYIFLLPGYTKSVGTTLMDNLVADTHIIGVGSPDEDSAPTLTWDATAAKVSIADKNVTIANVRMMMNGANDITEAIEITAANVKLVGNYIVTGTGASLDCVTAINPAAGATGFLFSGNTVRQTGGTTTQVLLLNAVVDGITIEDNDMIMIGSAAGTGLISISAAVTNLTIRRNVLQQRNAGSTACISSTDVAVTGVAHDNCFATLNDGVAANQGIVPAGVVNFALRCFRNYSSDENGLSGVLSPAACAT